MADARNKFTQPDEDTPFGRHLKEVTRYLNIGVPSFTGTYNATLPEEEGWMIQVQVLGRTFMPVTEPIEFSFDAPTWSLGKSMAAHITMGRIGEVYRRELKDTIYQICGRRDEQWDDQHQEGWINCSFHPGAKPTHLTLGKPYVCRHDGYEESHDQDHETGGRTQVYT